MEAELVLCDTDVWVEYLRNNIPVIQKMNEIGHGNIYASNITKAELQQWANSKERLKSLNKRTEKIAFIDIDLPISQTFSEIFEKHYLEYGCKIPDTLIAATAIYYNLKLFTLNKKHFQYFKGIQLVEHDLSPLPGKGLLW
jgi:tRNA(fMet)-specific endonuclease VapC